MVCHPVHRHRCAASARSRSRPAVLPLARAAAARMTMPGVQKPHCEPPVDTNASANGSRTDGSRPSRVVTTRPAMRTTGVTHATRASPSTSTVQHPHWPCGAQPSFAAVRPSRSRSTFSSVSPGSASTTTGSPLHVNSTRSDTCTSARQDTGMRSLSRRPLSRRAFLATTGTLLAAAACSSGDSGSDAADDVDDPNALTAGKVSIEPYVSTDPQRLAFVVFRNNGDFAAGPPMQVALKGPGDSAFGAPVDGRAPHRGACRTSAGVYVIDTPLPGSGVWESKLDDRRHRADGTVRRHRNAARRHARCGGAAGRVADHRRHPRHDPLCTQDPQCPLHSVSLDQVLGSGKPVAVMFATPARCQTQYCGPVLDRAPRCDGAVPGQRRDRARRDLPATRPATRSSPRSTRGPSRASRGCSGSTAPVRWSDASTGPSAPTRSPVCSTDSLPDSQEKERSRRTTARGTRAGERSSRRSGFDHQDAADRRRRRPDPPEQGCLPRRTGPDVRRAGVRTRTARAHP